MEPRPQPKRRAQDCQDRSGPRPLGSWVFAGAARAASVQATTEPARTTTGLERQNCAEASSFAPSVFGELIVLREVADRDGRCLGLPLSRTEDVTRALRGALLSHAVDPPPAALSGHTPDGRRLERPHAAFVALPGVRPDRVAGVAIALPREIADEERQAILLAAARWEQAGLRLLLGRLGAMQLGRADAPAADDPLSPARWLGPARRWATVTPIALQHNPGKLAARDPDKAAQAARRAEGIIAGACAHLGLPSPARVRVARGSSFPGAPSAPEFMPFPRPDPRRAAAPGSGRFQRVCVHAELEFAEPVEGPVLLGAGRYFGIGLCRARRE